MNDNPCNAPAETHPQILPPARSTSVDAIPVKRLFLPSGTYLQSSVSDAHATLLTSYDDGRAHHDCVKDLYRPFVSGCGPLLMIFEEESVVLVCRADRDLAEELRARGFSRVRGVDIFVAPLYRQGLFDLLDWAERQGIGLSEDAWEMLGGGSRHPKSRRLAWDIEELESEGEEETNWAKRLIVVDGSALRKELRQAIRTSEMRAVHLTPLPDGSLRACYDDLEPWRAQLEGCGALVIKKEDWRLRVYLPSRDWVSWGLQRALLDAWAEESFGEGTPWHWG